MESNLLFVLSVLLSLFKRFIFVWLLLEFEFEFGLFWLIPIIKPTLGLVRFWFSATSPGFLRLGI